VYKFSASVRRRPLTIKAAIGGLAAFGGEVTAQKLSGNEEINWRRTAAFTMFGVWWTGPFSHFYLRALDHKFPLSGGFKKAVVPKLLWQSLFINPFVYIPAYFFTICTSSGMDADGMKHYMSSNYTETLTTCSVFWLPITGVVFRFIPEHMQSVSMAGIGLFWNTILAYKTNQNHLELELKR